ncbi:hypothetical protein ANO11243_059780 [Dothideomycetidae sp. 11243]|nr:hypothetical protein ANO11243_059780 [fungal sp. No.11243]
MPPRVSRSSTNGPATTAGPKTNKRKVYKSQKRALNAFTAAQHEVSEPRVRGHRLGETEPERGPKRRRIAEDDDDEDEDEDDDRGKLKADDIDRGSDSEGNEWRMGGPIGEDSDSSLDSDEAFGSSDEERFEGFTFRGSSSNKPVVKKSKPAKKSRSSNDMDLAEQSEEEELEDDFGDEGVDLATMLDQPLSDEDEESGDEGDTEEDEDEDSDSPPSEAESDDDGAKISKLQDLVASLEGMEQRRNASAAHDATDAHEAKQPSDYGVTAAQKLKIADLLPTVTDPELRKSLKVLAADKPSKRGGIPGKLAAPLPRRQQDQLDRAAATAKAKEELEKWQDTVIHNRRAEHLHFPLPDPNHSEPMGKHTMTAVANDKPRNDLEVAIQSILEESGLSAGHKDEDAIAAAEELQMKEVPIEEAMARRAALRKARGLLFREEIKAKRIKKIKSKSYRRVHRKERERQAEKERALMGEDDLEDDKERQDRRRAEERMSSKHKESKWAKATKKAGRNLWDDDAREGVVDMARRNEELRKRIEGKEVRDEEGSDFSNDDEQDEDSDFDEGRDVRRDRLSRQLDKVDTAETQPLKGIAGMAFMRRAEAAKKAQNDQAIAELRRDLAREDGESESEHEQDADSSIGRRVFGPRTTTAAPIQPKQQRQALEEVDDSAAEDEDDEEEPKIIVERDSHDVKQSRSKQPKGATKRTGLSKPIVEKDIDSDDDWLSMTKSKKPGKAVQQKDSTLVMMMPNGSSAPEKKKAQQKEAPKAKEQNAPDTNGWTLVGRPSNGNDSDAASDEEAENPIMSAGKDVVALRDRAFAGDEVEDAFALEKADQMSSEDEKTVSNHLPGWGSWTGDGLSKAVRKRNAKAKHNPLFKTKVDGVRAADRRDAKLENVIISEAQQRKARKYKATQLPHGFERKEQYERSLRVPIGPEWTTKESFQRNTKPRVIVGKGNIEAIKRPLL